jgi:NAD(P)-dependent dehydrogenase (short-subunit alcohol dehydrogenase family)
MAEFEIKDSDFASLEGKVVVVTGCSSGIGLATVDLLLQHNARVVGGDVNPSPTDSPNFTFQHTDTASWTSLLSLFKVAKDKHNRIDHVFSNAGISGRADYLTESFDESGVLNEPSTLTFDIDLKGMINTSYLGLYHFRHQDPPGGSIVCTASASSFQHFRVADYTSAKHGVLGWMRGTVPNIESTGLPIRVNAVAPSWTKTGLTPDEVVDMLPDVIWQGPDAAARSVAILMADPSRQGELIYSWGGRFKEVEKAKLLPAAEDIVGSYNEDRVVETLHKMASRIGYV